jgi:hypothetical protein
MIRGDVTASAAHCRNMMVRVLVSSHLEHLLIPYVLLKASYLVQTNRTAFLCLMMSRAVTSDHPHLIGARLPATIIIDDFE